MRRDIAVFAAFAVLLLGGSAALIAVVSSGDPAPRMRVESAAGPTGLPGLLVTLNDDDGVSVGQGSSVVGLICRDHAGRPVMSARHPWPLESDEHEAAPHIHQPAPGHVMARIDGCTLTGVRPRLQAELDRR